MVALRNTQSKQHAQNWNTDHPITWFDANQQLQVWVPGGGNKRTEY